MRVGFRRIELVQEPLESEDRYGTGSTFLFQVNGVRMFMGGKQEKTFLSVKLNVVPRIELDSGR